METKITLANQSQEINIIPQEGFEIDLEKSDLKNGKVLFKEVKEKYPDVFGMPDKITKIGLYTKYATKLSILDTLLCLRDEYNRIDGFTEGFRFGKDNWCITNVNNIIGIDTWSNNNRIMYFGKEETGRIFLKNFEEQLEQIKEFL
jgi:hypothetical protein